MLKIGLTGGIGSGKSTVARFFSELGVPVLDADEVARDLVRPGQPALAEITAAFGADVLDQDGRLNRARLRQRAFASAAARRRLETILHPRVYAELAARLARLCAPYCIVVVPLLVETAPPGLVDRVLVVDVPETVQRQRLQARDGWPEEELEQVLAAQTSRARRLQAADDVLPNEGGVDALNKAVRRLHQRYTQLAASGPDSRSD
ncbi:MAG TPA: dephospho-CoA kinase [Gammaproteobacteria bacterium]|nr:dephospho-CoA kinase [Gammaproteobacteria bacterium]